MPIRSTTRPKVTIVYCHESADHVVWVGSLAGRLAGCGIDVILDQWDSLPGQDLPAFMEEAIRRARFVVVVCTPKYRARAEERAGGVGYETRIITAELLTGCSDGKFIPVLRAGTWETAAPPWGWGCYHLDLRGDPYREDVFARLVSTILGDKPAPTEEPAPEALCSSRPSSPGMVIELPDSPIGTADLAWAERILNGRPLLLASRRHSNGILYDFVTTGDGALYLPLPDRRREVLRQHRDFGYELSADKGGYMQKFQQTGVRLR